jgi:hypothetical protein
VFADVDRDSGNLTPASVERALTPNTRAIIPVHLGGWPCDVDALVALVQGRGVRVLEDCAQANGARLRGRLAGSLADAAAFSFCQDKIITTGGEGGLLATDDESLWDAAWSFKDHGKTWEAVYRREHAPGFRWLHDRFGTNGRLTEPQSAIGRAQLRKLDGWVEARRRRANIYAERLAAWPSLRIPVVPPGFEPACYRFYAYLQPKALKAGWSRERILATASERGLTLLTGSCSEIYRERAFATAGLEPAERLPVARELGETSLAFLCHPTLAESQVHEFCDRAGAILTEATR